jgi:hypothetical protein
MPTGSSEPHHLIPGRSMTQQLMPGPVAQGDTIRALLARPKRDHVPLRRSFVQLRARGGGAGPLAAFVRERRARALDLYLLVHAVASAEPWDVALPANVWVRCLGAKETTSAQTLVSRNWTWLERHGLITSQRRRRLRALTLLREDGSGDPYTHPAREGDYFKLPHAYWEGNFHNRLSLPAKALLLIALSLREEFTLPTDRGAGWYGLSSDTVKNGLRDLRTHGLLSAWSVTRPAPLTALGYTHERHYRLKEPFAAHQGSGPTAEVPV